MRQTTTLHLTRIHLYSHSHNLHSLSHFLCTIPYNSRLHLDVPSILAGASKHLILLQGR